MSWLTAALKSSVGRKYLMGLTGLFLCIFLVLHLAGNLLLFVGQETYDEYAHKLHSNPELLLVAEVLLFSAFAIHIALAISLAMTNSAAREQDYAVKRTKVPGRTLNLLGLTPDNTMTITGLVVFLFLVVHLSDFKFEWAWGSELDGLEPYAKAEYILADAGRVIIYLVGSVILGVHVAHGFGSAFQSIGLNHPKYTPTIKRVSGLFGLVVAVGFGCIPVVFPKLKVSEDAVPTVNRTQETPLDAVPIGEEKVGGKAALNASANQDSDSQSVDSSTEKQATENPTSEAASPATETPSAVPPASESGADSAAVPADPPSAVPLSE